MTITQYTVHMGDNTVDRVRIADNGDWGVLAFYLGENYLSIHVDDVRRFAQRLIGALETALLDE